MVLTVVLASTTLYEASSRTTVTSTATATTTVANTTVRSTIYIVTVSAPEEDVHAGLGGCSIARLTCTIHVYDGYPFGNVTIAQNDCMMMNFLIESIGPFTCINSPSQVLTYGSFATVNATLNRDSWNDGCIASCTPNVGTEINGSIAVKIGTNSSWTYVQISGAFTP